MKTSEKIDQIAIALSKAQKVMEGAVRDSTNPFFHSKYAELSEVWDACREPLTSNGLSFVQSIHSEEGYSFTNKVQVKDNQGNIKGEKEVLMIWLTVTSRLLHISEQYFEDSISMPVEADPQSIGKVTTYIRRYAQMALCGIAPVDDDGEAAANHPQPIKKTQPQTSQNEPQTEKTHEVVDKPQHWCNEHNCAFKEYSKGDKKWYSHNVGDKWCNEKKESEKKPVKKETQEEQPPLTDDLFK